MRLLMILWMLLVLPVTADEAPQPELRWVIAPYAPFHIEQGPLAGQGIMDLALPEMEQKLPGFRHENSLMTDSRAWQEIRDGQPVCYPAALKTPERERFAVFSDPVSIVPSMVLFMRADDKQKRFGERRTIALTEVLKQQDLRIGIISERSYGELDPVLRDARTAERVVAVSNNYGPLSLMRMLHAKRVDAVIEYPWIVRFVEQELRPQNRTPLITSLGIDELQPFFLSYVACADTELGHQVIRQVNPLIRALLPLPEHRRKLGDWLDPDTLVRYNEAYDRMLLHRDAP